MVRKTTPPSDWLEEKQALASSFFQCLLLLCALSFWMLATAVAQQNNSADPLQQADRDLSAIYAQSLARLTPENQKALREAERAWITFTEKNWSAWSALRATRGFTNEVQKGFGVAEIRRRSKHLEVFFLTFRFPYEDSKKVRDDLDAELTAVYASCMANSSPEARLALRDAQRAWITYRDLDADACVLAARQANRGTMRGYSAKAHLIRERTIQLQESYLEGKTDSAFKAVPDKPPNEVNSDLAPTEQFKQEAQTFLKAMIATNEPVLFGKVESLKKLPELREEFTAPINKLDARANEFANRVAQEARQIIAHEVATTHLLSAWLQFMARLSDGDIEGAAKSLPGAKARLPKNLASDYLPILARCRQLGKALRNGGANLSRAREGGGITRRPRKGF